MSKRKAVIFDIDGTLTDTSHRQHFMQQEPKDHDSFHAAAKDDPPIPEIVKLCQICFMHYSHVFFITGRPESVREQTVAWLREHLDFPIYHQILFMREDKDHRPDNKFKREVYEKNIEPEFDVQFVVEDRKMCVDLWRELGLVCLQCAPGDF